MKGVKHYQIFGRRYASIGWETIHTGTGFRLGSGFDVTERFVEIGLPRKPFKFKPIIKWLVEVRIRFPH